MAIYHRLAVDPRYRGTENAIAPCGASQLFCKTATSARTGTNVNTEISHDPKAIVYNIGTLYGQWPDGPPFAGNRYVDRYVVRRGQIVQMDVWNDSAEWMLARAGLAVL
jgi:hypothetical protein